MFGLKRIASNPDHWEQQIGASKWVKKAHGYAAVKRLGQLISLSEELVAFITWVTCALEVYTHAANSSHEFK